VANFESKMNTNAAASYYALRHEGEFRFFKPTDVYDYQAWTKFTHGTDH